MKTKREQLLEIALLKEKVENLSGKKVVFKEAKSKKLTKDNEDILSLIKGLEKIEFEIDKTKLGEVNNDGYYLKVTSYKNKPFKYWKGEHIESVLGKIKEVNKKTKEVDFIFSGVDDYEEDSEKSRSWEPTISFKIKSK